MVWYCYVCEKDFNSKDRGTKMGTFMKQKSLPAELFKVRDAI